MDLYEKLDALVKKAEELDAVGDKFVALDDEKNPAQAYAVTGNAWSDGRIG